MDVLQNPKYSYLLGKQPFFYKVFKTLFYFYSKFVFSTYAPTSVVGRENIPDSSFIFCSNHNSHMDVALLAVATKKNFNDFGMLAAASIPKSLKFFFVATANKATSIWLLWLLQKMKEESGMFSRPTTEVGA